MFKLDKIFVLACKKTFFTLFSVKWVNYSTSIYFPNYVNAHGMTSLCNVLKIWRQWVFPEQCLIQKCVCLLPIMKKVDSKYAFLSKIKNVNVNQFPIMSMLCCFMLPFLINYKLILHILSYKYATICDIVSCFSVL